MVISREPDRVKTSPSFFVYFTVVLVLLLTISTSSAATFKVTPEREEVDINDSFTVSFRTTGSIDGEPDFSPLQKDFSILSRNQRNEMSYINGDISVNKEWLLELMAKRDGELVIPSVSFGKDKSPEAKVTVKNMPTTTDAKDDIYIEVEALPQESWVQAEIIFTIRLYRAVRTHNASLSEPKISGGQMIVEQLGDRQYETYKNSKRYHVTERQYAIFPQASGTFTIDPIVFGAQVLQRGGANIFSPYGGNSRSIQRFSNPVELNIKAIPQSYTGNTWLPASNLTISEKWSKDVLKFEVGEPITRTVVISANGLSAEQLPELSEQSLEGFKVYPDQAEMQNQSDSNGLLSTRQEKSAVIPKAAGDFVLPAVELKWWNTTTGKMEIAQLPERVVKVLPAVSMEEVDDDVDNELAEQYQPANMPTEVVVVSAGYWPWFALCLGLLWFATLFLWWKTKRSASKVIEPLSKPRVSERQSLKILQTKLALGEPDQIKQAMLSWGKAVWPDMPPTSLSEIANRCGPDVEEQVSLLNQSLYSNVEQQWDGQRLLSALEKFEIKKAKEREAEQSALEPLNKI